jgi:hypothetical protein
MNDACGDACVPINPSVERTPLFLLPDIILYTGLHKNRIKITETIRIIVNK